MVIDNIIIVPHRFEVFLYDLIDFMSPDEKLKLFFVDLCVVDVVVLLVLGNLSRNTYVYYYVQFIGENKR